MTSSPPPAADAIATDAGVDVVVAGAGADDVVAATRENPLSPTRPDDDIVAVTREDHLDGLRGLTLAAAARKAAAQVDSATPRSRVGQRVEPGAAIHQIVVRRGALGDRAGRRRPRRVGRRIRPRPRAGRTRPRLRERHRLDHRQANPRARPSEA